MKQEEEVSVFQWAGRIVAVLVVIPIIVSMMIYVAGFFALMMGMSLYLAIVFGPPLLILNGGFHLAKRKGGPLGGVLVLLAWAAAILVGAIWCIRAAAWIQSLPVVSEWLD